MVTTESRARPVFMNRFGPWGLVAGASEGLGAAFATALARRGLNLVLVARRVGPLEALAGQLRARWGIEVQVLVLDLADPDAVERIARATAMLAIGLAIYNAAYAPVGPMLTLSHDALDRVVDVNVRGPLRFARTFAPPMVARRRGALVLMSSLAGMQGTPRLAAYAASKAFETVLAEGLWHELRAANVHVIASCAGAVRTPGYVGLARRDAPGTLDADVVAERTLAGLERGPRVIPGFINRFAAWFVGRLLPRRWAVAIMALSTKDLAGEQT